MNYKTTLTLLAVCFFALTVHAQKKKWGSMDVKKANLAIEEIQAKNDQISTFLKNSYGYAVFPSVGKGGIGIGGAHGKGTVFNKGGKAIGGARMTQITVGFQFGGQSYIEVIFFQSKKSFDSFLAGNFEFAPSASAVAVNEGASANIPYKNGVAVFTMTKGGLMYEATLGGQKFDFVKP